MEIPDAPRDDVRLQTLICAVEPPAVRVVNDKQLIDGPMPKSGVEQDELT